MLTSKEYRILLATAVHTIQKVTLIQIELQTQIDILFVLKRF